MGAGSYPFQKLFSRSHFAPKLGMPFVAELQQGKLSSAVLSFSTVEVCSSDLTHMHVIVTKTSFGGLKTSLKKMVLGVVSRTGSFALLEGGR